MTILISNIFGNIFSNVFSLLPWNLCSLILSIYIYHYLCNMNAQFKGQPRSLHQSCFLCIYVVYIRVMVSPRSLPCCVTVTRNAAILIDLLICFWLPPKLYLCCYPWTDLGEIDRIWTTSANILQPFIKVLRQMGVCDTAAPMQGNWSMNCCQSDGGCGAEIWSTAINLSETWEMLVFSH